MSAEIVECTADYARSLTDKIKVAVEGTWHLVTEAYQSRAWAALGYSSWDDYCTREFGTSRLRLPAEDRTQVVTSLRAAGLSVRAIASAASISPNTVQSDLRQQVYQSDTPRPDPTPVVGIDGKRYPTFREPPRPRNIDPHTGEILPPPEPVKPIVPRAPRTDVVTAMATVLSKTRDAAEAAERITGQHLAHRSGEAATWHRSLSEAIQPLQRLLTILQEKNQ